VLGFESESRGSVSVALVVSINGSRFFLLVRRCLFIAKSHLDWTQRNNATKSGTILIIRYRKEARLAIIVIMPASEFTHVIDWTEAMEQCGDDEDFLRELLSDLRGEIDAQIVKMDEVLEVRRSQRKLADEK